MRQDSSVDGPARVAEPGRDGHGGAEHIVQFYRTDAFLARAVTRWVSEALAAGDAALVIGTPTLRRALADRLDVAGGAVAEAVRAGRLVQVDSAETLALFCNGSDVVGDGFEAAVVPLVERALARAGSGRVRAYGDMVDLLWGARSGRDRDGAIVEPAPEPTRVSLLCGYRMDGLQRRPRSVVEICRHHTRVAPAEDGTDGGASLEVVLLAEIAEREETEQALRAALDERRLLEEERRVAMRRMERITRITAAIAAAVSPEEVYEAVVDNVAASLGASTAGLWVVGPGSRVAELVRSLGYREDARPAPHGGAAGR